MAESVAINASCDVYLKTVSYKGEVTETLEHEALDGWFEEGSVMTIGKLAGGDPSAGLVMGSAELFLWDDVELKGRIIVVDSVKYEVMSWHRRVDPEDDGTFSHMELVLR